MLDKVESILKENADFTKIGHPQDDDAICAAADSLGVVFPNSFKYYLSRFGWISFGPNEYYGIDRSYNNVAKSTKMLRSKGGFPTGFVVVADHDGDEYVCLDTSAMTDGECPVVIWDPVYKEVSRPRAKDFETFLETDMEAFLE